MNLRSHQKTHRGFMPVLLNADGSVEDFVHMPNGAMALVFESESKAARVLSLADLAGRIRCVLPVVVKIEIDKSLGVGKENDTGPKSSCP